jgi:trehalose monomycolate/heme transporter
MATITAPPSSSSAPGPTGAGPQAAPAAPRAAFRRWGGLMYRRRRLVLALTGVLLVVAGVWGTQVFGRLGGGGFEAPGSESSQAASAIEAQFGHVGADVVVVYQAPAGSDLTVADPAFRSAVSSVVDALPTDVVSNVATYWSTGRNPAFVTADGRTTYVTMSLAGADETAREDSYRAIADQLPADGLTTLRGGQVPVSVEMNTQVKEDIGRAEGLSFPILLILLVVVFGSLVAAGLPLVVGVVAILGAFTILNVLSLFTDVSIFAVNIVTMLGLGLAIDYALFVVGRFREQLAAGDTVADAVEHTVATAGRTVAISALTVAVSLGALLLFPIGFLRSMAFGGIAAVLMAMVAGVTVLPALLGVLGPRVNSLRMPWARRSLTQRVDESRGAWARLARGVMRRPVLVAVATVAVLAVLGLPFFRVAFGGVDERALPANAESRVAMETLRADFPSVAAQPVQVIVSGLDAQALASYVERLGALPDVADARVVASSDTAAVVSLGYDGESAGTQARAVVAEARDLSVPPGGTALVGGESARLVDLLAGIQHRLPWAGLYLFGVTFALLFLAFGSVVLPLKAMVMNVLSLSATFGILVWGFQEGHLSGLLGFTPTGFLEASQPVLIFAMAFGLSMDYEVFLLSRIREEWDRTGDNALAVERGLQRTGRIITSAALLFVVVVGAFATSGITFIQMIGVGLAVAVLVDATIVRALLVPATMRLLGRWNWYAPRPMLRFWERFGVRESDSEALPSAVPHVQPATTG